MLKKDLILLAKYIFIFLFLIFFPLMLYICMIKGEGNIFILGPAAILFNIIVSLVVPYTEIKLCQHIANKHSDTVLIKLFSTKKIPILILLFLICLDIVLPLFFIKTNDWLFLALHFYTGIVSFSGSFLPAFIMSIDYKNVMHENLSEFYDENNNFITVIAITLITFCLKSVGLGIFMYLKTGLHNLFAK